MRSIKKPVVQEVQIKAPKGEYIIFCLLLVIWSIIVFFAGRGTGNPQCQIEVFRSQAGNELVTVCVVE